MDRNAGKRGDDWAEQHGRRRDGWVDSAAAGDYVGRDSSRERTIDEDENSLIIIGLISSLSSARQEYIER